MVDDDRLGPALGLGPFAGIVDDEGVQVGHRSQRRFRKTVRRQRHRLARQPFQIAVLAHMDDGVRAEPFPQPGVEGEVVVRRHQGWIVIAGDRVDVVAARRLQRDRDIAAAESGNRERSAIDFARTEERVRFRRPPTRQYFVAHGLRQGGEEQIVVDEGKTLFDAAATPTRVGRSGGEPFDQGATIHRRADDPIAVICKRGNNVDRAGGRIESDTVTHPAVPVGIVRQHQCDAPVFRVGVTQPRPVGGEFGDEVDPIRDRPIGNDIGFDGVVAMRGVLEGDGAGQDAAVDFRQGDIHGDVAGGQASGPVAPALVVAAGEDGLQDRAIGAVEGCAAARFAGVRQCETGPVQDHGRRCGGDHRLDGFRRDRVLQAGGENRQGVESVAVERVDQRVYYAGIRGLYEGAVEHQRRGRPILRPGKIGDRVRRETGPVQPGAQQGRRFMPRGVVPAEGRRVAQQGLVVRRSALHAILPKPVNRLARQRRMRRQFRIRLIVARQPGQRDAAASAQRGDLLDAVRPVAAAAKQPHDDELRLRDDGIGV